MCWCYTSSSLLFSTFCLVIYHFFSFLFSFWYVVRSALTSLFIWTGEKILVVTMAVTAAADRFTSEEWKSAISCWKCITQFFIFKNVRTLFNVRQVACLSYERILMQSFDMCVHFWSLSFFDLHLHISVLPKCIPVRVSVEHFCWKLHLKLVKCVFVAVHIALFCVRAFFSLKKWQKRADWHLVLPKSHVFLFICSPNSRNDVHWNHEKGDTIERIIGTHMHYCYFLDLRFDDNQRTKQESCVCASAQRLQTQTILELLKSFSQNWHHGRLRCRRAQSHSHAIAEVRWANEVNEHTRRIIPLA